MECRAVVFVYIFVAIIQGLICGFVAQVVSENKGYEDIEEHIYEEKIEDKILMLEFAFDISKKIGIGMYIKRYSMFLKKLLKEIREDEKNPNFLADILEVYSQDWKDINDLGNK